MKRRYFFVVLISLINSQALSSDLTSRDSNRSITHPRHELYFQFFNPLDFLTITQLAEFSAEFSWKRTENKYFTLGFRHFYDNSTNAQYPIINLLYYDQVSFCHMHRFQTVKKWLSLEFDYGVIAGRRFRETIDEFEELNAVETLGAGLTSSFEVQFNIGDWGNVSLDTEMAVLFGRSYYYFVSQQIDTRYDIWPAFWAFKPGVTFYFGR